jgi:hypothetical protein
MGKDEILTMGKTESLRLFLKEVIATGAGIV